MLILYIFLILTSWVCYELVNQILHLVYLVKISAMMDSIKNKDDMLYLCLKDFEHVIAEMFKRSGYKVRMSDHFGDGGNGIILNDLYYVVLKKESYRHEIEIEQAKKLIKHMKDNAIYRGMIITLGDFKSSTKNYCHMNVITCINGNQLLQMMKEAQTIGPGIFAGY